MKIVFLYSEANVTGGIANVNCTLANCFLAHQHEVVFVHMRKRAVDQYVDYPMAAKQILINSLDRWDVPRLNEGIGYLKHLHVIQAIKHLMKRVSYDRLLKEDYRKCQQVIGELKADVIVCSHYECLQGISEDDLKKTFHHYHTDFSQLSDQSLTFLKQYNHQLAGYVWLSKNICELAKQAHLLPSYYIYNPTAYHCDEISEVAVHKKCVFIGRFSVEKRVELLIDLFNQANLQLNNAYTLDLYGVGEMSDACKQRIEASPCVHYKGVTHDSKAVFLKASCLLMTSLFEGLPLTLIEANECGVPCIAFNYGTSASEIILNHQTGILIEQDNQVEFVSEMVALLSNEERLIEMGKNAKGQASLFSVEKISQQWASLFEEGL